MSLPLSQIVFYVIVNIYATVYHSRNLLLPQKLLIHRGVLEQLHTAAAVA